MELSTLVIVAGLGVLVYLAIAPLVDWNSVSEAYRQIAEEHTPPLD